jgi:hypothetical protein
MKTTLPLLIALSLLTLTSAAPPIPLSTRNINTRSGTQTAAGILDIIGGLIPCPAGQIVGDVGKGLGGGKVAGAATTGSATAAKGIAGGAGKKFGSAA